MLWQGIQAILALATMVFITMVAMVVLDELTELPDTIRSAIRSPAGRKSLATRVEELEARLAAAERKLGRPAA
jgi:hypothetical protein